MTDPMNAAKAKFAPLFTIQLATILLHELPAPTKRDSGPEQGVISIPGGKNGAAGFTNAGRMGLDVRQWA